jgi:hypothetical protein
MRFTILLLSDTVLKQYTHAQDGIQLMAGNQFDTDIMPIFKRGHYRVEVPGMGTGYLPYRDVSILVGGAPMDSPPGIGEGEQSPLLQIPFLYVEDNLSASYNITAVAMILAYLKVPRRDPTKRRLQYEDEVASVFTLQGWRDNHPEHIEAAMRFYGLSCTYSRRANIGQVKDWLMRGRPILMEGLFDPWGTLAVALGITDEGIYLHLPYKWTSMGPDYRRSGERELYSISSLARAISPEDPDNLTSIGCHFIHRTA